MLLRSLSPELVAALEQLVAETVRAELAAPASGNGGSPYLTVSEAAELLRAKPQRVYDLLSARRLKRYRDGSRVLVSRSELETHLVGGNTNPLVTRPRRA